MSGKVLFGESELGFDDEDDDDDDGFDDVSDSLQKFEPNFPPATEQNRFVIKHTKIENNVQNKCKGVGIASHPADPGSIPSVHKVFSSQIFDVAEVIQRHY